jgi:hypothetical protein
MDGRVLAATALMGKHDRAAKEVKRLQLRREVIRVLSREDLARAAGGAKTGEWCGDTETYTCTKSTWPSGP